MTPAELDRLDRLMAEKLMKWQYNPEGGARKRDGVWIYVPAWSQDEKVLYELDEWKPTRNIAQAFQCLEKTLAWRVTKISSDSLILAQIRFHDAGEADTPALAICLAIKRWLEGQK